MHISQIIDNGPNREFSPDISNDTVFEETTDILEDDSDSIQPENLSNSKSLCFYEAKINIYHLL